ncbi:MAG: JmjC domain-containing protein [Pseudobdellovibrio sp.]
MRSKPVVLDQKFWTHFSENIWEKKPLALQNVKSPLLEIGEKEIFRLLVLFSDRCRKSGSANGFKFYINGIQAHPEDVLQVLPEKKDKNLSGYHKRMNHLFQDYCLVCDELLQANAEKQKLLNDFTNQLYRQVGFPNRFSEMGLYLGNYRKTPFGVHVDRCGVFSFPVAGQKKFRLWTSDFVKKNPALNRAFSYEKYKKNSEVITAQGGDITYWPSSSWHIAESDGSFCATWSLGVWVDKPHKKLFSESLDLLLSEKFGSHGEAANTAFETLHTAVGEVTELPSSFKKSVQILRQLTQIELEENFLKSWMLHISLQGFKNIPQSLIKLKYNSRVKLQNGAAKVLWQQSRLKKTKLFFSFGGVLIESESTRLLKLIKAVNSGESCLISDFIKAGDKSEIKNLQLLAAAGAFA